MSVRNDIFACWAVVGNDWRKPVKAPYVYTGGVGYEDLHRAQSAARRLREIGVVCCVEVVN